MKTTACLLAGVAGLFVPAAALCATTVDAEKEKTAIIAVLEEEKNAYLALDEARMAATWIQQSTSAKVYVFGGKEERYDGYAAIAAHDRANLARERDRGGRQPTLFEFCNHRITLQGDSAWLTCNVRWEGIAGGSPAGGTQARVYALQKENRRWRIALMSIAQLTFEKLSPPLPAAPAAAAPAAATCKPLKEFGDLIVGRWMAEVVWTVDYPGLGRKGEKVTGFDVWHWVLDGAALEGETMLGCTSGRALVWWDDAAAQIRTLNVDSGGNWAEGVIARRGGTWVWQSTGRFADGRCVEHQSELSFRDGGRTRHDDGATVLDGVRNEYHDIYRRVGD